MPRAEVVTALTACARIESWTTALADARPFPDRDAVLAAARELAAGWTIAEVDGALADHPRIGERHTGDAAAAALSSREQAGVGDDADVAARLRAGNAAYEERFGRIYLVRAKGRSAEELLALLDQRLTHDPATEDAVVIGQLAEIALLRLGDLLDATDESETQAIA